MDRPVLASVVNDSKGGKLDRVQGIQVRCVNWMVVFTAAFSCYSCKLEERYLKGRTVRGSTGVLVVRHLFQITPHRRCC